MSLALMENFVDKTENKTQDDWMGYISLALAGIGFAFQILYVGITGKIKGITLWWPILGLIGGFFYLLYGYVNNSTPILLIGAAILVADTILIGTVSGYAEYYRRKHNQSLKNDKTHKYYKSTLQLAAALFSVKLSKGAREAAETGISQIFDDIPTIKA